MTRSWAEWPGATKWAALAWVPLMLLVAMPFRYLQWPLPERGVPIMWLCLGGALIVTAVVARASWPFAALIVWATMRAAMNEFPLRGVQLLFLVGMVGLLYAAARDLSLTAERWAAFALCVAAAYEGLLGYVNIWGSYPGMSFVVTTEIGRPMGFLTHPNYWGSYMALSLPIVWSIAGILPAVAIAAMIAASYSAGPMISAAVGITVIAWAYLGRTVRYAVAAVAGAGTVAAFLVHDTANFSPAGLNRLSGRLENWIAAWPELIRYPVIGQGLGDWRGWAENYNVKTQSFFATLQAHNEPYQLWFELGLIGVGLAVLWALQIWQAASTSWRHCPPGSGAWWAPGAVPLERAWVAVLATALVNSLGSPTFHLPAQAAITIFALARIQAHAGAHRSFPLQDLSPNGRQANPEPERRARRGATRSLKDAATRNR